MIQDRFRGGQNIHLLFNADIVDFLFKTNGGDIEGLSCYFCSLESFSCPWVNCGAVVHKVFFRDGCFLVLFKDREGRVGPTFHLLVYDVYQENEDAG